VDNVQSILLALAVINAAGVFALVAQVHRWVVKTETRLAIMEHHLWGPKATQHIDGH